MAGLVPAIHVLRSTESNPWMPGTRPGMTRKVGGSYFRGDEAMTILYRQASTEAVATWRAPIIFHAP
jgi:hypothetical protein